MTPAAGLRRIALAVAAMLFAAFAHHSFSTVPAVVDGDRVSLRPGTSIAEVVAECSPARPGDVLAAADHRIIGLGAGRPVIVLVNGKVAEADETVDPGDRLQTFSGTDIVERVVEQTRTVELAPQVIGVGPIERVLVTGTVGVERVTVGTVSGDVLESEIITPAVAALVRHVPAPGSKIVALTFDDGPWPGQTEAVLDILAERDVPATFFMLGSRVKKCPDLARRIVEEGHAVGNHTYRHVHLDSADPKVVRNEIRSTNRMIAKTTGVMPTWFRAPGGMTSPTVFRELKRYGLRAALWTVDPHDWDDDAKAAAIASRVIGATEPGGVILLHDGGGDQTQTIRALPRIIDGLRARGYEFVTLDEMERVRASW